MSQDERTREHYDRKYGGQPFYWTLRPSSMCLEVLKRMPPDRPLRLLDVGCGEGRNAVFFARNGYHVHALDISQKGVEKTKSLAEQAGVNVHVFRANLNEFRLSESFDILFSTGTLHCCDPSVRGDLLDNYKSFTTPGGLDVFSVFVRKPFIAPAPDADPSSHPWRSGELLTHYHDWLIEWCTEEILDCMSSGVPHQHAVDRMIARKPSSQQSDEQAPE